MKIIWHILAVVTAVGIFISSSMTGDVSGNASMNLAVLVRYFSDVNDEALMFFHFLLRKFAHFTVYFVLAFFVAQSFKYYLHKTRILFFAAWGFSAFYGITDEIHQYFVQGRAMTVTDMIINATGAFFGAAFVVFLKGRKKC